MSQNPPDSESPDPRVWDRGWEEHELRQLRELAKLSLDEKLKWLEEAQRLVEQLEAARRQREEGRPGR